jgi:hypothetical protein
VIISLFSSKLILVYALIGTLLYSGLITSDIVHASPSTSGASYTDVPDKADSSQKYLFYMHGRIVELQGAMAASKQHGRYMYDDIVKAFVDKGFIVISEVRPSDTKLESYGRKVTNQIQRLLNAGVPPQNITVIGHSKGGALTLVTSAELGNPKVNFVVMTGCGIGKFSEVYSIILKRFAPLLKGRILSLYDDADKEAGSCREAFNLSSTIEFREIVFKTGLGHGLFYTPQKEWIDTVTNWATGL